MVAAGSPAPTLADLLSGVGPRRTPGNAAALLSAIAATLVATHHARLAHGRVGLMSGARVVGWSSSTSDADLGELTVEIQHGIYGSWWMSVVVAGSGCMPRWARCCARWL
jgi:hypothetical protein